MFLYRLNNVNHIPIAKKSFKNVLEWSVEEIMSSSKEAGIALDHDPADHTTRFSLNGTRGVDPTRHLQRLYL